MVAPISPPPAFTNAPVVPKSLSAGKRAEITRDQFFKMLITQLTNQDPLSPMDSTQFLTQMSTLQSIESNAQLSDTLGSVQRASELASASALIGRFVSGLGDDGKEALGKVTSVQVKDGRVKLVVGITPVAITSVSQVFAGPPALGGL